MKFEKTGTPVLDKNNANVLFETISDVNLYECESAIVWATSDNIDKLPSNFETLLKNYPIRRARFKIPHASQEYNMLTFITGSRTGQHKTNRDTIDSMKSIQELDTWLNNHLQSFYTKCILNTKSQIEHSLEEQKSYGSNPYCIVWRAPSMKNIPWFLIYLFLKVPGVKIGFIKSSKRYFEMRTEKETNKETVLESAKFKTQFNWVSRMLKQIVPIQNKHNTISDIDDILPKLTNNEINYCLVWYGPKNDIIPNGLSNLMLQFPNVCIGHKDSDLHEIWLITKSYSWYCTLPDAANVDEIRKFIQLFLNEK
jgi:hypothetical protein